MANTKYITIENLKYYHQKLMKYIEEKGTSIDDILEIIGDFSGNTCYVRYYDNYGTDQKIVSVEKNTTITIAVSPFTRDGYTFKYWTLTNQDTGEHYVPGDNVEITENISLFAQWEEVNAI